MELKEQINSSVSQMLQNQETAMKNQKTIPTNQNQIQKSELLPTTSDDSEEEKKILDFIKSRVPDAVNLRLLRTWYPGKTLDEVKKYVAERDERNEIYRKEEEQRKFSERQRRLKDLIKSSGIPKIFSDVRAKDFKTSPKNEDVAKIAIQAISSACGLFIYGECGTGKTMLSSVIANERAELFKPSMFISAVDIFHELNPYSSNSQNAANKKQIIKSTPCLIVDDLGAEKPSDWTKQTLFEIIDYRYRENLQTIITSNFNIDELKTRLSDYEGNRIIRRIKAICKLVELKHF